MPVEISVSLSRKISENYNSDCVVVGLDSEIHSSLDRPSDMLEEISKAFRLVEQAIDEEFKALHGKADVPAPTPSSAPTPPENGGELATDRQRSFIQTLFKRANLREKAINEHITQTFGRFIALEDLSKKEAAKLIDSLTATERN